MEGLFTKVLVDVEVEGETPRRDSRDEISGTTDEVLMCTVVFHMFICFVCRLVGYFS